MYFAKARQIFIREE